MGTGGSGPRVSVGDWGWTNQILDFRPNDAHAYPLAPPPGLRTAAEFEAWSARLARAGAATVRFDAGWERRLRAARELDPQIPVASLPPCPRCPQDGTLRRRAGAKLARSLNLSPPSASADWLRDADPLGGFDGVDSARPPATT